MICKLKRVQTLIVVFALIIVICPASFARYSDVPETEDYYEAVMNLSAMEIINGYSDGIFKPNGNVTRAQFVKMMVKSTGNEGQASASNAASAFTDVKPGHWAAGYINSAVKEGIITGYADGSFAPEENVNFAQVCTVLLRSLGYISPEMTGVWPYNYIEKAKALQITKGVDLKPSDKVSRAQLAIMLERTLNAKVKDSSQTLAEKSGLGALKTAIITGSWDLDSTLPRGAVKTDIGEFRSEGFNGLKHLGEKVNILVNESNVIISAQNVVEDSRVLFLEDISGNRISYCGQDGNGTMDIPDNMTFYYQGQKSTFGDVKQNAAAGSLIALAITDTNMQLYNYGVMTDPPAAEPVIVKKDVGAGDKIIGSIDISGMDDVKVIKNGKIARLTDIKLFDVAYLIKNLYKPEQGIIMVYDKKKTGSYDDAIPSKNAVQKIKLLGEELVIETSFAAAKLNESQGAFAVGDQITVLTGRTGGIVDVITPSSTDVSNIAVIVSTRSSISTESDTKGKEIFYVTLYKIDGSTSEYEVNEDQESRKGRVVRFDVKDGTADIIPIAYNTIYGRINPTEKMIGDLWLSQDAVVLDIHNSIGSRDVEIKRIDWQDMPSGELRRDKVIHAEMGGAFNDIQLLVLNNLTESGQYGILVGKNERGTSSDYTLMINGRESSFSNVNAVFDSSKGDVVCIEEGKNSLEHMYTLNPKDTSYRIQAVDSRRIRINNRIYKLADNIQIYDITEDKPVSISTSDLTPGEGAYVALYSGRQSGYENIIRVITVTKY